MTTINPSDKLPDRYPSWNHMPDDALELCKQEKFTEALLTANKSGYDELTIMFILLKINRQDTVEEVKNFILSKYHGNFGHQKYPVVHKIFIEHILEEKLSRELTNNEQQIILNFLNEISRCEMPINPNFGERYAWHIETACDELEFSSLQNVSPKFKTLLLDACKTKTTLKGSKKIPTNEKLSWSKFLNQLESNILRDDISLSSSIENGNKIKENRKSEKLHLLRVPV